MGKTARSNESAFEEEYFAGGSKRDGSYSDYDFESYRRYYRHYLEFFRRYFRPGERMLELGCAKGTLVASLCEGGFEAFGVDVSRYAVGSAPVEVRDRLRVVDLDSLGSDPQADSPIGSGYAAIVALGVLEYTASPSRVLHAVAAAIDEQAATDRPCLLIKTLTSTGSSDKLRVSCLPRSQWLATAEAHGFIHDVEASNEFERSGFDALHAFALRSTSIQGRIYALSSRLLGERFARGLLRRKNANLLFLAFKRRPI
jgi:SAM-dependent methyltransferase